MADIFFQSSTNKIGIHCMPDSGHVPRMILAHPWSKSHNDISAIFVRLLNTNPNTILLILSPGLFGATRVLTDIQFV